MSDMRSPETAFTTRASQVPGEGPDPTAVRAIATCVCGGFTFVLKIYSCGYNRAHCTVCDSAWEEWPPKDRESGQDRGGSEAVAKGGDEPGDLVSAEEREIAREIIADWKMKKQMEKVKVELARIQMEKPIPVDKGRGGKE